jgi:anti-sigma B factor antagonist
MSEVGHLRIDEVRAQSGAIVLALEGEADLHVAPELRQRLTSAIDDGARSLVLDLSQVTFVDSTALGIVLGGQKRIEARGGQLRLVVPNTDVRRIFEITLLDRVLTIDATRDAALSALGAPDGIG